MIVVDASTVVRALVEPGERGGSARYLLLRQRIVAPDLIDAEAASAIRRRWLAGLLSAATFADALGELADLPILRVPNAVLLRRVYEHRDNVSAYDACYVGLAEALEAPLYTADVRLSRAPGLGCEVRLIDGI